MTIWIVCIYNNRRISLTPFRSKYHAEYRYQNMIIDIYPDVTPNKVNRFTSNELNHFVDDGYYIDEELNIVISLHQERIVYGLE